MESIRTKLIISGGGTRGIYQIGALKALEDAGFFNSIVSVSGCSIGAINSALLFQHKVDDIYEIWKVLAASPLFKNVDHSSNMYPLQLVKETLVNKGLELDTLRNHLREYLDEEKLRQNKWEFVISCCNFSKRRVEYHNFNSIPHGLLVEYLLASARLPVFQNHTINGDIYLDGGFVDNEPHYSFLENKNFDLLIRIKTVHVSSYLFNLREKNISYKDEIVIKPSGKLGFPLNFKNPSFDERYQMGYNDAQMAIANLP